MLRPTRAGKVDDQIQRYIGIKTLISAGVGFLVYVVLGPMLHVKLAHLFGVLTFFMNYIPNVGPIIATGTPLPPSLLCEPLASREIPCTARLCRSALPLPIIVLDMTVSTSSKLLAVVLPTCIHLVIGNFLEPKVCVRARACEEFRRRCV
jgi:predicted PurR-regulated permease PerM